MNHVDITSATPEPHHDRLQAILLTYLEAEHAGKAPSRQEWLAEHPDLTGELAGFLDDREKFRLLAAAIPVPPFARPPLPLPKAVGSYEILGELGRGGMGVVFKARQAKLQRLVALKMVLDGGLAGPHELARFRSEGEAVARLQHPNIVQIYEVGEYEGRPFFSLEYVEGGTLAQRIGGKPQPTRQAAAIAETLARAIDYAHQQGVVHRDLKPANVLLTQHGMPKITDFGLAKRLEGSEVNTRTGAIVGTPSYLSPEQAMGRKDVGPAADIFALGAVLHELLTGRPPFRGDTAMETIFQAVSCEVLPLRVERPDIPRDLETICLKCLEKDPRKRYGSAAALASDLRRFLNGEAITARPIGTLESGWRYCRRRPVIASLAAAIAVMLLIGVPSIIVQWLRAEASLADATRQRAAAVEAKAEAERQQAEAERQRAEAERQRAEAERQRAEAEKARGEADRQRRQAEASFQQARQAVYDFFTLVGEHQLLKTRNMQPLRRQLLLGAQKYYEDFLRQHQDDRWSKYAVAETHFRLGTLLGMTGDTRGSLREFEQAQVDFKKLLAEQPNNESWQYSAARCQLGIGRLLNETGRTAEAERSLEAGRASLEGLLKSKPGELRFRAALIFAYNGLGTIQVQTARIPEAIASYSRGHALADEPASFRTTPAALRYRASFAHNLAGNFHKMSRIDEARTWQRRATTELETLLKAEPKDEEGRHLLGVVLGEAPAYADAASKPADILKSLQRSSELLNELVQESPAVTVYRFDLSATWLNSGLLKQNLRQHDEAVTFYQAATRLLDKLCKDDPGAIAYPVRLADIKVEQARCLLEMKKPDEARVLLTGSRMQLEEWQRRHPKHAGIRQALTETNNLLVTIPAP